MPYQKLLKLELKSVGEIVTALPESSLSLSLSTRSGFEPKVFAKMLCPISRHSDIRGFENPEFRSFLKRKLNRQFPQLGLCSLTSLIKSLNTYWITI